MKIKKEGEIKEEGVKEVGKETKRKSSGVPQV